MCVVLCWRREGGDRDWVLVSSYIRVFTLGVVCERVNFLYLVGCCNV